MNDFNVDSNIYCHYLSFLYINKFSPESIKIDMESTLIKCNLEKKEWFDKNGNNGISPLDVVRSPNLYFNHYKRMKDADMSYPIIIWKEKELVIDGNHRIGHAYINRHEYIDSILFNDEIMSRMVLGTFKNSTEYSNVIRGYTLDDLENIFRKKFIDW